MSDQPHTPSQVQDLIQMASANVTSVVGVEPDFTPETLPLVDQYLRQVPQDATAEVRSLVVASVGCYFGEVLRRLLNGRWAAAGDDPRAWRVELINCFLYFFPVGMAGEVMAGGATEEYNGSFSTLSALREELTEALDQAAPLPVDEYYSLAGRVDVIHLAADWLAGRAQASEREPYTCTAEDYAAVVEAARAAGRA